MTPPPTAAAPPPAHTGEHDLFVLLQLIFRKARLAGFVMLAVVAAAVVYLSVAKVTYQSKVSVQVEQQERKVINFDNATQPDLSQAEILKTLEQSFKRRSLMEQVLTANQLADHPEFWPQRDGGYTLKERVDFLLSRSNATLRRGTRLIDVTFEHELPAFARLIAQSIVDESIKLRFQEQQIALQEASSFLRSEATNLRIKLEQSEQVLQTYREKVSSAALEDRQNIIVDKLKDLNRMLTEVESSRIKMEADYKQIELVRDDPELLLSIGSVAESSSVAPLRNELVTQQSTAVNLAERYTEEHPKMIQARTRLAELRRVLNETALKVADSFRHQLEATKAREASLKQALDEQERVALKLSRQTIEYNVLRRDAESDQALYQAVVARMKETQLTTGMRALTYRLVEPATPPTVAAPLKVKVLVLACVGGLLLAIGTVLALNWFDSSLQTVDNAEHVLTLPVLAAIPSDPSLKKSTKRLPMRDRPGSEMAEAVRTLRASLLVHENGNRGVIGITSALPGEGKTIASANLAVSLAQQGFATLLIDADLRQPAVEPLFFATTDAPGLADYLAPSPCADNIVRSTQIASLSCITAGRQSSNPAELLSSSRFSELLADLSKKYAYIVIDTAPVNVVSDTLLLVEHMKQWCLVVDSARTPRKAALHAVSQLRRLNAKLLGIIVNRLPHGGGLGHYYHYATRKGYGRKGIYTAAPAKS